MNTATALLMDVDRGGSPVEAAKNEFEIAVGKYVGVMCSVALRLTGNPATAETLVYDTLQTAATRRQELVRSSSAKPWLMSLLRATFVGEHPGNALAVMN